MLAWRPFGISEESAQAAARQPPVALLAPHVDVRVDLLNGHEVAALAPGQPVAPPEGLVILPVALRVNAQKYFTGLIMYTSTPRAPEELEAPKQSTSPCQRVDDARASSPPQDVSGPLLAVSHA